MGYQKSNKKMQDAYCTYLSIVRSAEYFLYMHKEIEPLVRRRFGSATMTVPHNDLQPLLAKWPPEG